MQYLCEKYNIVDTINSVKTEIQALKLKIDNPKENFQSQATLMNAVDSDAKIYLWRTSLKNWMIAGQGRLIFLFTICKNPYRKIPMIVKWMSSSAVNNCYRKSIKKF